MKTKFPVLLMIFVFGFISCQKEGADIEYKYYNDYAVISEKLNLPDAPISYETIFPSFHHTEKRVFNADLATLGRVLFYDTNLSKDASVSCASCHKQELGFSDDVAFSKGSGGLETDRNSIALGSVFSFDENYGRGGVAFFWDNRAFSVQDQSSETFANAKEMDMEMHEVVAAVKNQTYYKPLFDIAFDNTFSTEKITDQNILDAISEFINSMSNTNSNYDYELENHFEKNGQFSSIQSDFSGFTAKENLGKKLYLQNCSSCHGEMNQLPGRMEANNGLDLEYLDQGIGGGSFKVPVLRNISLTAPYMHDGRFATLGDVIDHYSDGIKDHPNLDNELKNGSEPKKFNFTEEDKEAILAFFDTFTDNEMLTDPKYSDPFKK